MSKYRYLPTTMVYKCKVNKMNDNITLYHIEKIQLKFISTVKSLDSTKTSNNDNYNNNNDIKWTNDIIPFPWSCYEGDIKVNNSISFLWNKLFISGAFHNEGRYIINFNDITINSMNFI